jgi:glycine/D-amino acid oxidase-like deaminating enzyme
MYQEYHASSSCLSITPIHFDLDLVISNSSTRDSSSCCSVSGSVGCDLHSKCIQGTSVAYHLAKLKRHHVTILEAVGPATAASGKGGGFMARSWGDGGPTQPLHELAFDMYESMAQELSCESYRKLPVLSVTPGYTGVAMARNDPKLNHLMPNWLDGKNVGRIQPMGYGDDTAQITPSEFVAKMLEAQPSIQIVLGTCTGFDTDPAPEGRRKVTGVQYNTAQGDQQLLVADAVVVSAGPWSCQAEDWIKRACGVDIELPMEGVKSASIVWEAQKDVDATALFCGEDDRFGTHCKQCLKRSWTKV